MMTEVKICEELFTEVEALMAPMMEGGAEEYDAYEYAIENLSEEMRREYVALKITHGGETPVDKALLALICL